jgi:3',5'-nucleoside bisphosphate phosphatase
MTHLPSIDLHFHSVYSEGVLTPNQLARRFAKRNIKVAALTDHNTITGTTRMIKAGRQQGIRVIPGIEIYIHYKKHKLHLLGYNFDLQNAAFYRVIHDLCHDHSQNIEKSLTKMQRLGFDITHNQLIKRYSRSHHTGFGQIVDTLKSKTRNIAKLKKDFKDKEPDFFGIINKYFTRGKPAYLPLSTLPAAKAISLIKKAGGITSLAHPAQNLAWNNDDLIIELKKMGLAGIEVFSPYHHWHAVEHYLWLANKYKMLITGGSDYHNDLGPELNAPIKNQRDYYRVPYTIWQNLKKHIT